MAPLGALMIGPPWERTSCDASLFAVAELPTPADLVLDDFGEISDRPSRSRLWPRATPLATPPRRGHLSDPEFLHLDWLRVAGRASGDPAADLVFTEQDQGALLRQAGVSSCPGA